MAGSFLGGMFDRFNPYANQQQSGQPVQPQMQLTPEQEAALLAKYEQELLMMQQQQAMQAAQAQQMQGASTPQAFDHVKARQQMLRRYAGYE